MKLKFFVLSLVVFLFISSTAYAEAEKSVYFHFISLPNKTAALIDWVKIFDSDGNLVGALDFGKDDNNIDSGSYVVLDESGGHWGDLISEGEIIARPVNGRDSKWEHSAFFIKVSKPISEGMILKVRYKDAGKDLMPIEYINNDKTLRIGQVYLENSGKWLEDEFDIPVK